jgi:hypothetical protein
MWQPPQLFPESEMTSPYCKKLQELQPCASRLDSSLSAPPSALLLKIDAEIAELESRSQASEKMSQAQSFALKKQLQMKRAERIRAARADMLASASAR